MRSRLAKDLIEQGGAAVERIGEIAEILAAGLLRLEALKSSRKPAEFGESSLHFTPDQSGDQPSCSDEVSP
jgi:hypothetical protein